MTLMCKYQSRRDVISAAPRTAALINFLGIDNSTIDCVLEVPNSLKIGCYVPGTRIPVIVEDYIFEQQPDYALMFSWHISDYLSKKLWNSGYKGKFIIPFPRPEIISRESQTVTRLNSHHLVTIVGQELDLTDLIESLNEFEIVEVIDTNSGVGNSSVPYLGLDEDWETIKSHHSGIKALLTTDQTNYKT